MRTLALALVVLSVAACDLIKKDEADAAPPVATATATAPVTAAQPTATVPTQPTPVAPLGATTATPATPGHPAVTDGGKTAPAADGGTAPAPTPTFVVPTAIPGFDAGGFKPPPGFPTAIPTFPPPQQK
jgi:hypothetical protein